MRYGKAVAAVVYAALVTAYQVQHGGGAPTPVGWVQVGIAAATAAGVYLVPITPDYPWVKSALAALLAALQILTTAVVGGVQGDEWMMIALAVAAALGVYGAPASTLGKDDGEPTVSVGYGADTVV